MPAAHFLFSGDDVPKITSLTMDEAGPEPGIPVGTWRLRFRQNSPGPVQIRPLLPGGMRFIADPAEAGGLPTPDEVSFAAGASSGWRTRGRLMIRTGPGATRGIATDLPIVPNRLWYGPVELSEPFLFETLCSKLARKKVLDANQKAVQPSRKDWANHAVSEFLAGEYEPHLTLDDIGRFLMPTVVVPDSGDIELLIGAALWQTPFDGPMSAFDDPPFRDDDPDHPANGPIPARAVYRSVRPHLVSEQESEPLRDLMLAEWPDAPRFFPIRFTRTWEPVPECSVHLPRQLLSISLSQTVVQEHPLPAHGVVLFRQDPEPSPPQPGSPTVAIVLAGTMTWLLGGGPTWLNRGATDPVEIDLAAVEKPHVVVRLPMAAAILADWRRPEPGGGACTYISLRRTVRAFVDNRIAGGRLAAPFPDQPNQESQEVAAGREQGGDARHRQ